MTLRSAWDKIPQQPFQSVKSSHVNLLFSILTWDWESQQAHLYWSSCSWKDVSQIQKLEEKLTTLRDMNILLWPCCYNA